MLHVVNTTSERVRNVPKEVFEGQRAKCRWALIYVGAPYGDNESGHVVRSSSEYSKISELLSDARYYGSNSWIFDREEWEVVK